MAKKTIYTIGFSLPGDEFIYKGFNSEASLLDADIILFEPKLSYSVDYFSPQYNGKPSLSEESSAQVVNSIKHWKHELKEVFNHGKTVLIFLRKPEEVFVKTGSKDFSGTGKNQKVIHHVDEINSYLMLPINFKTRKNSIGQKIKFTKEGTLLKSYWDIVKDISSYEIYFEHEKSMPLAVTKSGDKTIASYIQGEYGNFLLLPPLNFPDEFYNDEKTHWTSEALKFSKSLLKNIVEIDKTLRSAQESTPAPEWIDEENFSLKQEDILLKEIVGIETEIEKLRESIISKHNELSKVTTPKQLLFENGKPLENAIIDALLTLGFEAENFQDDESEFDIVFKSEEGRFIGEAEGKDSSAINISKLQQLERNIQEDFAKEGVEDYAKGVLFGNPERLIHPNSRTNLFTTKAISAAKRSKFALVCTHQLFKVVKYLKENTDEEYAKKVRETFQHSEGEIIVFPEVPKNITNQRRPIKNPQAAF